MENIKHIRHGWVNLYRGHSGNPPQARGFVHPTEQVARAVAHLHGDDCIATVKVEWEGKDHD